MFHFQRLNRVEEVRWQVAYIQGHLQCYPAYHFAGNNGIITNRRSFSRTPNAWNYVQIKNFTGWRNAYRGRNAAVLHHCDNFEMGF